MIAPIKVQNRNNSELQALMGDWGACEESRGWLGDTRDMKQALAECPKIGWIVFMARILAAVYGDQQPEYRVASRRIFRIWKRMHRLVNHLDVEQATETKPVFDKYYAAKAALLDARREDSWIETSQRLDSMWMDTLAELKPFDAKYERRRKAYHREALKAVRRRVVIED